MLEFFFSNFKDSYKKKAEELLDDLRDIFKIYDIPLSQHYEEVLPGKLSEGLSLKLWDQLNLYFYTLQKSSDELPPVLKKYINKKDVNVKKKHQFIDIFAGCGGLSLGLEKAGFNPYFINEIEPRFLESYYYNRDVSLKHYHCGDIREISDKINKLGFNFSNVELVAGGPPCQGFSMANRQRIVDDPRNILYKFYLQFLSKIRPLFFIMENVKGILSHFSEIEEDFHRILGNEYSIEMVLLNAKDFGIPQNRERVIVIGSRLRGVCASQLVSEIEIERTKTLKKFTLGDAIQDLPILLPNKKGLKGHNRTWEVGVKYRPFQYVNNDFYDFINGKNKIDLLCNHTNRFNNDRDIEIFSRLPQGANSLHPSIADIMPYKSRNSIFKDKYFKLSENSVCKTITRHMQFDCNMYIHPTQSRGLSPREAARIQTFPDDFIFLGHNNCWYSQIGNAVPVKLAEVVGEILMRHLS